ncbi:hypothetical protein [Pseudomonas sp. NPDC079086]|uniref:hypothetical protein n=1 Tax=unclassified Pseudomonas TaxID=196821 RepID=UPI0037CB28D1
MEITVTRWDAGDVFIKVEGDRGNEVCARWESGWFDFWYEDQGENYSANLILFCKEDPKRMTDEQLIVTVKEFFKDGNYGQSPSKSEVSCSHHYEFD